MRIRDLLSTRLLVLATLAVGCSAAPEAAHGDRDAVSRSTVRIEELALGGGAPTTPGKRVTVNYRGFLANGAVFDSSRAREQPLRFQLGRNQVIAGWEQGLLGMRVGGKRRLVIPPSLAFGARGNAANRVPANATVSFEVELLGVD